MEKIMAKLEELSGQIMTKSEVEAKLAEIKSQVEAGASKEMAELKAKIEKWEKDVADIKSIETPEAKTETKSDPFVNFLRKGLAGLTPEERKTMVSNDNTTGGYLAGEERERQLVKDLREIGQMRKIATVRSTNEKEVVYIRVNNLANAQHVGEGSAATAADFSFDRIVIPNHILAQTVYITDENLEDSQWDLEKEVMVQITDSLSQTEESDFTVGTGVNMAEGFIVNGEISVLTSSTSGVLTADDIKDLYGALKTPYNKTAVWVMNRATMTVVAKLKNGSGDYVFDYEPLKSAAGSIGTLLGRPVYEMPDMADVASSAKAIAFGDFKRGYVISDRRTLTMKRDDMTLAEQGVVKLIARRRVGGQVVQPEAIKILQIKA